MQVAVAGPGIVLYCLSSTEVLNLGLTSLSSKDVAIWKRLTLTWWFFFLVCHQTSGLLYLHLGINGECERQLLYLSYSLCVPLSNLKQVLVMCTASTNVNKLLLAVEDLCQIEWDLLPLLDLWWMYYYFYPEVKLLYWRVIYW